jgi:DNA-binding transcriptional regulator LsrR (DeoR family)
LAPAQVLGVTWGGTIGATIEALATILAHSPKSRRTDLTVVPTSGEPLGGARPSCASSELAERLGDVLGAGAVPSLRGIPPVIPEEFRGRDHAIVLQFIRRLRSFREVFGDEAAPGLVATIDTVLTSAGTFGDHYHAFQNEFVRIPGLSRERLGAIALGDIGGVLVPREGLTRKEQKTFHTLRDLWTGIRHEDFQRISQATCDGGAPGVILTAIGASKAPIVRALACREQWVNQLVIDHELAAALAGSIER